MASFEIAKAKTLRWEGGYANHPNDTGGETIFGIARNSWGDNFDCKPIWDALDTYKRGYSDIKVVEKLMSGDGQVTAAVNKFYKTHFWDKLRGDNITDQNTANALFDFAVNSGVKRASQYVQRICGVEADGIIGPKTIEAINAKDGLCNELCKKREEFFHQIVKNNPSQEVFLKGWLKRVGDFYVE